MPIYALQCRECGAECDVFRHVADRNVNLPTCCAAVMERRVCAPYVRGDLSAYQAVAVDAKSGTRPVIEGRVQHREFLRRNDYVEAADIKPQPRTETRGDFNVRKDLAEATRRVLSQPGHVK